MKEQNSKSDRGYHHHRERQRAYIIGIAEKLFYRDGIESVTIADIADVALVTRATIYRYFANRLEIAWAVQKKYIDLFQESLPADVYNESLTVVQRLRFVLTAYRDYFFLFPIRAQYFVQFDTVYVRIQELTQIQELNRSMYGDEDILMILVRSGIRDGTLLDSLEPITVVAMLNTILRGLERKLTMSMESFEMEFGCSARIVYTNACEVILRGIAA
jgi:AcrR family transcriptional regulator